MRLGKKKHRGEKHTCSYLSHATLLQKIKKKQKKRRMKFSELNFSIALTVDEWLHARFSPCAGVTTFTKIRFACAIKLSLVLSWLNSLNWIVCPHLLQHFQLFCSRLFPLMNGDCARQLYSNTIMLRLAILCSSFIQNNNIESW